MTRSAKQKEESMPTIALVGRVNVGKSTLFNRLIEEQKAIVSDIPGTTRTSNEGNIVWRGKHVHVVDTGGLTFVDDIPLESDIIKQTERAVRDADLVVFVTDAKVGILPQERELAKRLRRTRKAVMVVANKVDRTADEARLVSPDWQRLGFGEPLPISGANGRNLGDFLDAIFDRLRRQKRRAGSIEEKVADDIRISVIGKPNVGKSSLFNKLIGEEKVIVSPMPHTTREPHDVVIEYEYQVGKKTERQAMTFIDTAGIRRKAQVEGELEKIGVSKSIRALQESDIILLVLDGNEPLASQDLQLGGMIKERAKSVIIVVNKWDLIVEKREDAATDRYRNELKRIIMSYFPHLDFAPIIFTSSLSGQKVHQIFPTIMQIWRARHTEIPDAALQQFLQSVTREHRPSRGKGTRHPEITAMRQIGSNPPVFELYIKYRTSVHSSYLHFIENKLRERFDFFGTPIILKLTKLKR